MSLSATSREGDAEVWEGAVMAIKLFDGQQLFTCSVGKAGATSEYQHRPPQYLPLILPSLLAADNWTWVNGKEAVVKRTGKASFLMGRLYVLSPAHSRLPTAQPSQIRDPRPETRRQGLPLSAICVPRRRIPHLAQQQLGRADRDDPRQRSPAGGGSPGAFLFGRLRFLGMALDGLRSPALIVQLIVSFSKQ